MVWQVNLLTEKATVEFDSSVVTSAAIAEEIDDIGYEAELQVLSWPLSDLEASQLTSEPLPCGCRKRWTLMPPQWHLLVSS